MTGSLLFAALVALPVVYLRGRRNGFERHQCAMYLPAADRAPMHFLPVRCVACGELIECELSVKVRGGTDVVAELNLTDLKLHRLRHEGVS